VHKIAVIGAGRIGKIHAANATAHPRVTLKCVVDPATPEGYDNHTPFVTAAAGGAILGFALTTYSLGVPGGMDTVSAGKTGFSPQLVPLLGHSGQRGVALAGLF